MNFDLTDDQRSIQRTAREFLAAGYKPEEIRRLAYETERGFTDEGWQRICKLGWPALLVDEEHGGLGLGVVELAVVQEELGAALAPSPFLSTVSAAALIADAGSDEQRERWLPALAAGEARGTVATLRDGDGWAARPDAAGADVIVGRDGDGWGLAGGRAGARAGGGPGACPGRRGRDAPRRAGWGARGQPAAERRARATGPAPQTSS